MKENITIALLSAILIVALVIGITQFVNLHYDSECLWYGGQDAVIVRGHVICVLVQDGEATFALLSELKSKLDVPQ